MMHEGTLLRIQLLGAFRVTFGGQQIAEDAWRLRKASSLVKLLALTPNHALHREQLCDLLWPDLDFDAAHNNLRYALHVARRILGHAAGDTPILTLQQQTVTLCPPARLWLDIEAFEAAAATARRSYDPLHYQTAVDCYTGDLLPEDRYEDWSAVRRETLRETYRALLRELAALQEAQGEPAAAIATLRRAIAFEPADEGAHAGLIRLHALAGERAQALAQYTALRAILKRELDATPLPETERLYAEALAGSLATDMMVRTPPPAVSPIHTQNLPTALTRFIGREREREEIAQLLEGTRLLTLIGAGGSGKSRLALAVAHDCLATFADGVWLVELAATADPALVPRAIAAGLNLREEPGRTHTATLVDALRTRRLLLVLDNCEHLIDACATLAETLLTACPDLHILTTSRAALRLPGETIWRVPSLAVPEAAGTSAAHLMESEAVQLFVDRVRWRQPTFALTDANIEAVAAICRQLDGMPLALELAAARAGILTMPQLAARLNDALRLLTDGGRTAPPRQRTLRATLDWSYALLDAEERTLLGRLAVFAGGCTLEAAEAICAGDGIMQDDVLPLLAQLADKSLVQVEAESGEARYRLLEIVRQYAREQLAASGDPDALARRHATYFLAYAEELESPATDPRQASMLARLETDHDNLRAALRWARDRTEYVLGLRLAAALGTLWDVRGYLDEGRAWLEDFAARTDGEHFRDLAAIRAKALAGAALLADRQSDTIRATALAEQALALSQQLEDTRGIALALHLLGMSAFESNDYERALTQYTDSLMLYRALGDTRGIATALGNLGRVTRFMGDAPRATAFLQESEALRREIGDLPGLAIALGNQGHMAREQGDSARAAPLLAESLALYERFGNKRGIGIALNQLAQLAHDTGDDRRAQSLCERSLALRREIGDRWGIANSLCTLGEIVMTNDAAHAGACYRESLIVNAEMRNRLGIAECLERSAHLLARMGDAIRAAQFLGAASALRGQIGAPVFPVDRPLVESAVTAARATLGDAGFTAAWDTGQHVTITHVIAEALRPL